MTTTAHHVVVVVVVVVTGTAAAHGRMVGIAGNVGYGTSAIFGSIATVDTTVGG